jgi:hypothetical protein
MINNVSWKGLYSKEKRPQKDSLDIFWTSEIRNVFTMFSNEMAKTFGLSLTNPVYTRINGWKFKFTKSGIPLIKNVIIENDCFYIDNICVENIMGVKKAIEYTRSLYTQDFINNFEEKIKTRNKKQMARSKQRVKNEKEELEIFVKRIDPAKLNKFKWSPKISIRHLIQLYKNDAQRIIDSELLNEVGFTFYARCLQGRDENLLGHKGKLKCHNCREILTSPESGIIECKCGHSYVFREYMRSFNRNSMPSRSATPFFNKFIEEWPKMKSDVEKMRLIDWIIHECHLNMLSGVKRGFAGLNLIEGSKDQVVELINQLAYGDIS